MELVKLSDYDGEANELDQVGNEARCADDVVENGLQIAYCRAELGEIRVVNHEGRIEEEEILDNVTDGEHEGQDEHGPLGNCNESLDANVQ